MTTHNTDTPNGRVCVSIAGETLAATMAAAQEACRAADLIEIRLDALANAPTPQEINTLATTLSRPLLFTNRPTWEGGSFSGTEEDRLSILIAAAESGPAYVDLELKTEKTLRDRLLSVVENQADTRLILSWHDFSGTPPAPELARIFAEQAASGAQIGKMVTMAHGYQDVLRVLTLQELAAQRGFPLIAFCMGRAGTISRLATLELGGYMTYAAPDSGAATAPGQLTVSTLRAMQAGLAGTQKN